MSSNRITPARKSLVFLMVFALLLTVCSSFAFAAKGDFSSDFVAAAPYSYNHLIGGGAYDDRTIGKNNDVVESLESSDFKKDDIVTYLTEITVADVYAKQDDSPQTVEIDYEFTANTTGQPGAAFVDFVSASINRSPIVDLREADSNEDGMHEVVADSTATLFNEVDPAQPFTAKALLTGSVRVDGLQYGETIILRTDVRIDFQSGASPTGNLQATIKAIRLVKINGDTTTNQSIPVGAQTVPFKIVDYQNPVIGIVKTTRGYDGTYSDGPFVAAGSEVKWRYAVSNLGNVALSNVHVDDNMLTAANDPHYVGGDTNLDGKLDLSETWIFEATGTAIAGTYNNTGTAYGTSPDAREVNASDPSSYFGSNPQIAIVKTTRGYDNQFGDGVVLPVGAVALWRYVVTNTGNVTLSSVHVDDNMLAATNDPHYVSGDTNGNNKLDLTETWIFEASGTAGSGLYENTGTAYGTSPTGAIVNASEPSSYTGLLPLVRITKTGNVISKYDRSTGQGHVIQYTIKIENISDSRMPALNGTVTDPKLGLSWSFTNLIQGTPQYVPAANARYTVLSGDDPLPWPDPLGWRNLTNTATVNAVFAGIALSSTASDNDSWTTKLVHPQIDITKSVNRNCTVLGDTVEYTITITNTGDTDLENVVVTDTIKGSSSFMNGAVAEGFPATLAKGASATRTFTHLIVAGDGDPVPNTAAVHATPIVIIEDVPYTLSNDVHDSATVNLNVVSPILRVTKTLIAQPFNQQTYTLLVENISSSDTPLMTIHIYDPRVGIDETFNLAAQTSRNTFSFSLSSSSIQPYVDAWITIYTGVEVHLYGEP